MLSKNTVFLFVVIFLSGVLLQNCSESLLEPVVKGGTEFSLVKDSENNVSFSKHKVTGDVEIIWNGGNGNNPDVEPKRAFAEITAHQDWDGKPAKGAFIYRVMTEDIVLKREIIAEVHKVYVEGSNAWAVAKVISDSKGCNGADTPDGHSVDCPGRFAGGSDSGHGDSCGGDHTDDGHDDSCGGDHTDDGHDDSCGGDHTDDDHDDSCGGDHTDDGHDDSCTGDHTDDGLDDSCGGDHTDDGTDDHSGGGSNKPKGHSCRVDQRVFIMISDNGTPGINSDEIEWKWFYKSSLKKPVWLDFDNWHLCAKGIIEGNLVIH